MSSAEVREESGPREQAGYKGECVGTERRWRGAAEVQHQRILSLGQHQYGKPN
jgi:hypothetical protein